MQGNEYFILPRNYSTADLPHPFSSSALEDTNEYSVLVEKMVSIHPPTKTLNQPGVIYLCQRSLWKE